MLGRSANFSVAATTSGLPGKLQEKTSAGIKSLSAGISPPRSSAYAQTKVNHINLYLCV
jgi:hypothetical protein